MCLEGCARIILTGQGISIRVVESAAMQDHRGGSQERVAGRTRRRLAQIPPSFDQFPSHSSKSSQVFLPRFFAFAGDDAGRLPGSLVRGALALGADDGGVPSSFISSSAAAAAGVGEMAAAARLATTYSRHRAHAPAFAKRRNLVVKCRVKHPCLLYLSTFSCFLENFRGSSAISRATTTTKLSIHT